MSNYTTVNYGYGLKAGKTEIKIREKFFFKSQKSCVVNFADSYKDVNGKWQHSQYYALWIDNSEVWDKIKEGVTIKIKTINSIKFTSKYSPIQTQQVANIGNTLICNVNCNVEIVDVPYNLPNNNNQNVGATEKYQYQDYADLNIDDLDLPF